VSTFLRCLRPGVFQRDGAVEDELAWLTARKLLSDSFHEAMAN
jgi:hypothetical protein